MRSVFLIVWSSLLAVYVSAAPVADKSGQVAEKDGHDVAKIAPARPEKLVPVLWKRILWYLPNRVCDLADVIRLRFRAGPGFAANMRFTDFAAFYCGEYESVYGGLPGPRYPRLVRWPAGKESLKGIILAGVDATDDTYHGPEYGFTECDLGVHLLLVGAEAGVDPFEIWDFLAGFLMLDPGMDDYPRLGVEVPESTSGVSMGEGYGVFRVEEKPPAFNAFPDRLDYLNRNVHKRVNEPVRRVDERMAKDPANCLTGPETRLRMGMYMEAVQGDDFDLSLKPDIDLDVAVPNIEERLRIFVQSSRADHLPGRTPSETRDKGLTLGVRRLMKDCCLSADAGVRARIEPEAYARLTWHPVWKYGKWVFRPQQRVFFETDEKFGALSALRIDRWLGDTWGYYVGDVMSAKWTQESEAINWEQTLRFGRARELIEEYDRPIAYARQDIADGEDINFSIFGEDKDIETYRVTMGVRRPLYRRWIFWEVEPGLEWRREEDFDTAFRVTFGIDMLFWGPAYR